MSKKIEKQNNLHVYILIGIFLAVLLFLFNALSKNQSTTEKPQIQNNVTVTPSTKTYRSEFLEINFSYPSRYSLEERFGTILLKNKEGKEIIISRNGTNYDNLETYLLDIADRSSLNFYSKQNIIVNENKGIKTIIRGIGGGNSDDITYYFYKENNVYFISTDNPALYSDLDQIARSFRFTP